MKLPRVVIFLIFFPLASYVIVPFASGSSPLRGVAPEDVHYYKSAEVIKCRDGSNKFTRDRLNDDFCDCLDGTDEPGTSACPNGSFYCRNSGHAPLTIFSSRVNDGICDCCDGSDEHDGKIKCTNTCWEAGKAARNRLKKKIETFKEGAMLRKHDIEQAKLALAKDEEELDKLKKEETVLKELVQRLKEHKEQIEKAEEKERLEKEKQEKEKSEAEEKQKSEAEEKEKGEAEEKANPGKIESEEISDQKMSEAEQKDEVQEEKVMGNTDDDKIGLLEDPPLDQDAEEHYSEAAVEAEDNDNTSGNEGALGNSADQGKDEVESTEELSKEELGRRVASRWTGEKVEQQTAKADIVEKGNESYDENDHEHREETDHDQHEDSMEETHDDEDEGYASETDEDHNYDEGGDVAQDNDEDVDDSMSSYKPNSESDVDSSDDTFSSSPTWLEKIQLTVKSILQTVNLFQTPVDTSDADRVRKEYDESSGKLSKMQSRISSLTKKLKHDFGPDKEFYSSYGRCFETKQNKYTYKVCPFKQASQVEGHSTTQLGHWEKFEDTYRVMLFSNGDKCWNGPDRSLKVKLRCGLKNEVTDVDEPSRCEYVALLSTPAVCLEERLKELQNKLDALNKEQPDGHDEL